MFIHSGAQGIDLSGQRCNWRGIAFGQLLDAPGQGLRHAVEFGLHADGERAQPFVLDHQRFHLVGAQCRRDQVGLFLAILVDQAQPPAGQPSVMRIYDVTSKALPIL